jgi:hypothetical protein
LSVTLNENNITLPIDKEAAIATFDVRPPARLKGERNEIEKLMAGWRVTTC